MTFGLQCDEPTAVAILDRSVAAGITFIDTADSYPFGSSPEAVGRTEVIVGRWLRGRRGDFVLATKFGRPTGSRPWQQGGSRKHVLDAIDASLRRLQTDYVDLYQMHLPDPGTPIDETLAALDLIVRSGRARYIGCSNFLAYQLARALGRSEVIGAAPFVSVQARYNLLFREIERELLPLCGEEGIAVLAYNPLAGGLLTGKHDPARRPDAGRFSEALPSAAGKDYFYWHEREFATIERLRPVAAECGMPLGTLAMAWILANPAVACAVVGASRPEQLEQTLAALDRPLAADVLTRLDELTREYRHGDAAI